jgi:hypothetical protein
MNPIQTLPRPGCSLASLDPADLRAGLEALLQAYQSSRSLLRAWLVVHYAETLSAHPELEEPDEQRCAYRRLARHWRWLATNALPVEPAGRAG